VAERPLERVWLYLTDAEAVQLLTALQERLESNADRTGTLMLRMKIDWGPN
jgi:hypothetical protein